MRKLSLRSNSENAFVSLPVEFIDIYMPEASAEALKVYLYLQRAVTDPSLILSVQDLSDLFDVTPKKITQALQYWEHHNLLSLIYDDGEITGITLLPVRQAASAPTLSAAPAPVLPEPVRIAPEPAPAPVLPESVSEESVAPAVNLSTLYADSAFSELTSLAEAYLGRPLNSTQQTSLGVCYLSLWKKTELVEYLIEHCLDSGHSSLHYMEAVAKNWAAENLTTVEAIKASSGTRNNAVYAVMKELGLRNREPSPKEEESILSWTRAFELPVVQEACRRTMASLHSPDFKYVSGILNSWRKNNVRTLDDVRELDSRHAEKVQKLHSEPAAQTRKNAFTAVDQRNTDYDSLLAN